MKYSEFEKIAKENGWELDMDEVIDKWVHADKNAFEIAISKSVQNYFDLWTRQGGVIDFRREKSFIKACYELAETPIEDREDEKYYTVELPFLNYEDKKIILNGFNDEPFWSANFPSLFTEKEIKELDPRLWDFAVEDET